MLNKKGMAVSVFDCPGHGKSSGKRGHTSINAGINIIDEVIDEIGEKPFLFGNSMGGLTAVRYAEIYPNKIKGLVASAPVIAIAKKYLTSFNSYIKNPWNYPSIFNDK